MAMGKTLEVTVKLKVEPDGKVTQFSIVEGSGNAVVDESVREAGKSITKLPPPPNKEAFSAPVRFELGNWGERTLLSTNAKTSLGIRGTALHGNLI
jgi:TonB family protein